MSKKTKIMPGLGKGLSALIPNADIIQQANRDKVKQVSDNKGIKQEAKTSSTELISIKDIIKNPYQPRQDFDTQALEDLKNSIEQHGIIQPITVRRTYNGYELIAGERRLRASTEAGLHDIPAYIIEVKDGSHMLELAIIENVQREDLNPVEEAYGYQRLIDECKLTQEEVAQKVGKNRTTITNFLRLLKLPDKVHESLRLKQISMGHARALLGLDNNEQIISLWHDVVDKGLSVRETENQVKSYSKNLSKKEKKNNPKPDDDLELKAYIYDAEDTLRQIFATEIKIKVKSEEGGSVELEFYSKNDLERLMELLEFSKERL